MKRILLLTWIATVMVLGAEPRKNVANATNQFLVTGMHCKGCAAGITSELKRTRGVQFAEVTLTNQLAVVAFDTNRVSPAALVKVIQEAGYEAAVVKR